MYESQNHIDLFSGIGGFASAADTVFGNITHTFVENEPFCQAVLKKHWPKAEIHGDIREFIANAKLGRRVHSESKEHTTIASLQTFRDTSASIEPPFLLTGGFPCQPFSQAGRRKGTADDRYLWPEMFESITLFKPRWVIAENVAGLITWNNGMVLEQVCSDLESEGYEVQPFVIPAVSVNAPHRRDRVWIIAHTTSNPQRKGHKGQEHQERQSAGHNRGSQSSDWTTNWHEVATKLCTLDDGLPNGLVRPKGWRNAAITAAGNAIVPKVAIEIMQTIREVT